MSIVKSYRRAPGLFSDFLDTRFFDDAFLKDVEKSFPAVNVTEKNGTYHLEMAIPGYKKDAFKVDVDGDIITISGERQEEKEEKEKNYTRKEFSYGSFSRSFQLPQNVEKDKINATYENGILKLDIPAVDKKTAEKKQISVK